MLRQSDQSRTTTLSIKVSYQTYQEVRRKAKKSEKSASTWVNQVLVHHLNESFRLPRPQALKVPPATRLITTKKDIHPNSPVLYKDVPTRLRELAAYLGVSFLYMHRRLKRGETLIDITKDLERD
jgi:hypothetical protein